MASKTKLSELSEGKLINQLQNSPRNSEARNELFQELWCRYKNEVDNRLRHLINYAPEGWDREYFLEEVRQLTAMKLHTSIDTYRRECSFKHWLGVVIRSVVIDTWRMQKLRSEREIPLPKFKKPAAEEYKEETDEETLGRLAFKFNSNYYVASADCHGDPSKWEDVEERKHHIQSALSILAQSDPKCAKVVRKRFWEELKIEELVKIFSVKSDRTIYRWLHNNLIKLKMILNP